MMKRLALLLLSAVGLGVVPVAAQASVSTVWSPQTSAGAYDFGQTTPGTPLATTFHLTNTGTTKTAELRISIKGGSGVFKKMRDTCRGKSLAKGKSCLVRVTYAPNSNGASDTATLAATNTARTTTYATLTLSGSTPPATPKLVITPTTSPDVYDFGSTTGTQTFTVTNMGSATAQTQETFGVDDGPLHVYPTADCFPTVAPGAQCTLSTATYTVVACGTTTYSAQTGIVWDTATDPTSHQTQITLQAEEPAC